MRVTSSSAIGVLSMLLNSACFGHSQPNTSRLDGANVGARFAGAQYIRVRFRRERDGTVVAYEKCGCEADAASFRPCGMHREDAHQAARLRAEARYHGIQKCCQQGHESELALRVDIEH